MKNEIEIKSARVDEAETVNERVRFHENYFGQTAAVFTCPNEFELKHNSLRFNFDGWISAESFDRNDPPLPNLRVEFNLSGDEFEQIKKENPFFSDLENVALDLCSVGGRGYHSTRIFLTAVGKFLTVAASSADGFDRPTANKYGAEYDAVIASNLQLIGQIVVFMTEYGKKHDEFLALCSASK